VAHAAGWSLLHNAGQTAEALPYALSVAEAAQGAPELFDAGCLVPRDAHFGRVVALEEVLLQHALKPTAESQRRFARAVASGCLMGIVEAQPPFVAGPLLAPLLAQPDADPTLLLQGAKIARLSRRPADQRQLLRRALERLPTDPGVRIELLGVLLGERMFADAEQLFMHTGVLLKAVATLMPQATRLSSLVPYIVPGPQREWRLGLAQVRATLEDVTRLEELSRTCGPAILPPLQALVQDHLDDVVKLESKMRGSRAKAAG
jgi:hypothetical protein